MRWFGLLSLSLFLGCFQTVDLVGKKCDLDHPCPGTLVCVEGLCQVSGTPASGGGTAGGSAGGAQGGGTAGGTAGGAAGGTGTGGGSVGGGSSGGGAAGGTGGGSGGGTSTCPPQWVRGGFTAVQPMLVQRGGHTATLLPSGRVLIAGGSTGSGSPYRSTEYYDPIAGSVLGPEMSRGRTGHVALLLPNGNVVVAGGLTEHIELFDENIADGGMWFSGGDMANSRSATKGAWLPRLGRALFAMGGYPTLEQYTELCNPYDGTCYDAGALTWDQLDSPWAILAPDLVLFPTRYGELYNAASPGAWTGIGMNEWPDSYHQRGATITLDGGFVLVTAGRQYDYQPDLGTAIRDPATGHYTDLSGQLPEGREFPRIARVGSTHVLLVSGYYTPGDGGLVDDHSDSTAVLLDLQTGLWSDAGTMLGTHGTNTTVTELPCGAVLICGGGPYHNGNPGQGCEVFTD